MPMMLAMRITLAFLLAIGCTDVTPSPDASPDVFTCPALTPLPGVSCTVTARPDLPATCTVAGNTATCSELVRGPSEAPGVALDALPCFVACIGG
jgi:hypothetical protein